LKGYDRLGRFERRQIWYKLVDMSLDWSNCPDVERCPGKMSGAWVLKGTRMPISTIFDSLAGGANIDEIVSWHDGLNAKQLHSVVGYSGLGASAPKQ
jgi:uncharacterized protein (DUF433 family)